MTSIFCMVVLINSMIIDYDHDNDIEDQNGNNSEPIFSSIGALLLLMLVCH